MPRAHNSSPTISAPHRFSSPGQSTTAPFGGPHFLSFRPQYVGAQFAWYNLSVVHLISGRQVAILASTPASGRAQASTRGGAAGTNCVHPRSPDEWALSRLAYSPQSLGSNSPGFSQLGLGLRLEGSQQPFSECCYTACNASHAVTPELGQNQTKCHLFRHAIALSLCRKGVASSGWYSAALRCRLRRFSRFPLSTLLQPPDHSPHLERAPLQPLSVPLEQLYGSLSVPVRSFVSVFRRDSANKWLSRVRFAVRLAFVFAPIWVLPCFRHNIWALPCFPPVSEVERVGVLPAPQTPDTESTSTELAPEKVRVQLPNPRGESTNLATSSICCITSAGVPQEFDEGLPVFSVLLCLSTDANCRVNVLGVCSVSLTLGQHHRQQSVPLKASAHQGIVLELFHIHSRHRKICSRSGYNHRRIRQTHNYSTLTWVLAQLIRRILLQQPLLQPPDHNPHLNVPRFNLDGYLSVPVRSVGFLFCLSA